MLSNLIPLNTQLRRIHEIPSIFFQNIEAALAFDDTLFPVWTDTAFAGTDLKAKFKTIYDKYKLIADPLERSKIIDAFTHNNQIANLCNNQAGVSCIPLNTLHESIRTELDTVFLYMYNTAINYHGFTAFIADNLREAIDRFMAENKMQICPICGLEGYMNLEGQARTALDHWLCKDIFPVTSVNFDNLFPLGEKCNGRPAKGTKNLLLDEHGNRIRAYYPYLNHQSATTSFAFNNEPTITPLTDADWNFDMAPMNPGEQYLFDSWNDIFNILKRYKDFVRKYVIPLWENDYKTFIEESEIGHAADIPDLKTKFNIWKASFKKSSTLGAIAYRAFIDNMINNVSEAYLHSLCENFKRQPA